MDSASDLDKQVDALRRLVRRWSLPHRTLELASSGLASIDAQVARIDELLTWPLDARLREMLAGWPSEATRNLGSRRESARVSAPPTKRQQQELEHTPRSRAAHKEAQPRRDRVERTRQANLAMSDANDDSPLVSPNALRRTSVDKASTLSGRVEMRRARELFAVKREAARREEQGRTDRAASTSHNLIQQAAAVPKRTTRASPWRGRLRAPSDAGEVDSSITSHAPEKQTLNMEWSAREEMLGASDVLAPDVFAADVLAADVLAADKAPASPLHPSSRFQAGDDLSHPPALSSAILRPQAAPKPDAALAKAIKESRARDDRIDEILMALDREGVSPWP